MVTPRCPYFGKCGGCSAQDTPYEEQLARKKRLLQAATRLPEVQVFSSREYGYRNRMDFAFSKSGIGLREQGKWYEVVDIKECPISEPRVNQLLAEVRSAFSNVDAFDQAEKKGTYRYALIRNASGGAAVSFALNRDSPQLQGAMEKINEWSKSSSAENVIVALVSPSRDDSYSSEIRVVKGSELLVQNYLGKDFYYSSQGFFQNNHVMAQSMQAYVHNLFRRHALEASEAKLLDLYAGVGTFGIVNSGLFRSVLVVESAPDAIACARKNIAENNVTNVYAMELDAKRIRELELPEGLFVITDPPRSGMDDEAIMELNKRKPKVIVYISCNLQQLSKDLQKFVGYKVRSAALFDLFPQTQHCEGVVELVRD